MSRMLIACAVALFASAAFTQEKKDDKKPEPKGEPVSGRILLDGMPLPVGTVTFVSKDGKVKVAAIVAEDGTYKATVPEGEYGVAVSADVAKKDDKDPPKKRPVIPAKYGDVQTSGIVFDVAKGKNTLDLELKSK